jgi:hypothetical protein
MQDHALITGAGRDQCAMRRTVSRGELNPPVTSGLASWHHILRTSLPVHVQLEHFELSWSILTQLHWGNLPRRALGRESTDVPTCSPVLCSARRFRVHSCCWLLRAVYFSYVLSGREAPR